MSTSLDLINDTDVQAILADPHVRGANSLRKYFDSIRSAAKAIGKPELAAELITKGDDGFTIHVALIDEEEGYNPRNYERPDIAETVTILAERYAGGMHVDPPTVVVRNGKVFVREGHTRRMGWRKGIAEMGANIKRISVIKFKGSALDEAMIPLTSNQKNDLTPLEKAEMIRRGIEQHGQTVKEMAKAVSMSENHIRNHLKYLELPADMQQLMTDDRIAPDLALELYSMHGADAYAEAMKALETDVKVETQGQAVSKKAGRVTRQKVFGGTPAALSFNKARKQAVWSTVNSLAERVTGNVDDLPDDADVQLSVPKRLLTELLSLRQDMQAQIEKSKGGDTKEADKEREVADQSV